MFHATEGWPFFPPPPQLAHLHNYAKLAAPGGPWGLHRGNDYRVFSLIKDSRKAAWEMAPERALISSLETLSLWLLVHIFSLLARMIISWAEQGVSLWLEVSQQHTYWSKAETGEDAHPTVNNALPVNYETACLCRISYVYLDMGENVSKLTGLVCRQYMLTNLSQSI